MKNNELKETFDQPHDRAFREMCPLDLCLYVALDIICLSPGHQPCFVPTLSTAQFFEPTWRRLTWLWRIGEFQGLFVLPLDAEAKQPVLRVISPTSSPPTHSTAHAAGDRGQP